MAKKAGIRDSLHQKVFNALYQRSLIYNTCWEDPALDREALTIGPDDRMLVITSAGCNVLDYALCNPAHIDAVDANPRQTALLEMKMAGIRHLDHSDFFALFGESRHSEAREIFHDTLRQDLSDFAADYWSKRIQWFQRGKSGSFYYHGLSGVFARFFRHYLGMRPKLRQGIHRVMSATELEQQRDHYDREVAPYLWSPSLNWALSQPFTMSLLGVPHPQREEINKYHSNGIAGFVRDAIDYVFRQLPVWDNYFWSVYVFGKYTPDCCPEYLKPDNFQALKDGLVDRIEPHTTMVTDFLRSTDQKLSRFVLLDHMDWMSAYHPQALIEEWQAILDRATPDARLIFRSAHAEPDYLSHLQIPDHNRSLGEILGFDRELANRLHVQDRLHTYAGFHIAHLA